MGRALLTASAVFLVLLGAVLNLAPGEAAAGAGLQGASTLTLQLLAGALVGVGVLDWLSRTRPFGGVYGRPLGLANLLLFVVGAFALGRAVFAGGASPVLWAVFLAYAAFALLFLWIVFAGAPTGKPE